MRSVPVQSKVKARFTQDVMMWCLQTQRAQGYHALLRTRSKTRDVTVRRSAF